MTTLWICEKPSQARDIAAALGVVRKDRNHIETKSGIVTWCLGHLLEAKDPDEYDPALKNWNSGLVLPETIECLRKQAKTEADEHAAN